MTDPLRLSWSPPPTINLTGINPDLYYNVSITKKVMNGSDISMSTVACEECPLSTPEYILTHETGPCVSYRFKVFAFNAAGRGESTLYDYYSDVPGWSI